MKRLVAVSALVAVFVFAAGFAASADSSSTPCTVGDAAANFEAPLQHLFESLGICQYRLFFDGETFTFCEDDVILGGVNDFFEYKAAGLSREAAIALLELDGDRVWLDDVEQPLLRTAYKDGLHPFFGHGVYQHRAFITQLTPGDHVSYYERTISGDLVFTATVNLHILPRTDDDCR